MDYELLEQLLDDLATPLARYATARVRVARALGAKNMRGLEPALRDRDRQLADVDALIGQYAETSRLTAEEAEAALRDQRGYEPASSVAFAPEN